MFCLIKTTSVTLQHLQEVPVWSALPSVAAGSIKCKLAAVQNVDPLQGGSQHSQ